MYSYYINIKKNFNEFTNIFLFLLIIVRKTDYKKTKKEEAVR
ncbi:hypothetical protein QY97_02411 [Bacillus thermotolerans]|nr:hypothetical protein QY97_02411 [Bacillus thermotolerans]